MGTQPLLFDSRVIAEHVVWFGVSAFRDQNTGRIAGLKLESFELKQAFARWILSMPQHQQVAWFRNTWVQAKQVVTLLDKPNVWPHVFTQLKQHAGT